MYSGNYVAFNVHLLLYKVTSEEKSLGSGTGLKGALRGKKGAERWLLGERREKRLCRGSIEARGGHNAERTLKEEVVSKSSHSHSQFCWNKLWIAALYQILITNLGLNVISKKDNKHKCYIF